MPVVAFDAKPFLRGKAVKVEENGKFIEKYLGFHSHIGIGVNFNDDQKFVSIFTSKNDELRSSFQVKEQLPFYSSTQLKQILGMSRAIAYAEQLITAVQGAIDSIHCSYIILPPARIPTINVGGLRSSSKQVETTKFLDALGPMFSYLTCYSFMWENRFSDMDDLDFHIDAFRSKLTNAWDTILQNASPKIYFKGDECNPFICCADLVAFLTDVKLYTQHLRLEPTDIQKTWNPYSFRTTVRFLDDKSLNLYAWKNDEHIDYKQYLTKPTVFLIVDEVEKPEYADIIDEPLVEKIGVQDRTGFDQTKPVKRKFHQVIKRSDVYYSAIRYAYHKKGNMKIFHRHEDMDLVADGDVLVYVGPQSMKIANAFKDAWEVEVLSGLDLRKKVNKL